MQRFLRLAVLIPTFVVLPMAGGQTAKEEPKIDEAAIKAKAVGSGTVQGKLKSYDIDGAEKKFVVTYAHQTKKLNPAVQKQVNELAAKLRAAAARKDKNEVEKIRAQGNEVYAKLYDVTETPIEMEFVGGKDLAFRTAEVPTDNDGKPKKDAKADPKFGGYPYDPKLIDIDMIVKVVLDPSKVKVDDKKTDPKAKPADPKAKPADPKAKEETKDDAKAEKVVYPISAIIVIPPPEGAAGGGNPFLLKGGK